MHQPFLQCFQSSVSIPAIEVASCDTSGLFWTDFCALHSPSLGWEAKAVILSWFPLVSPSPGLNRGRREGRRECCPLIGPRFQREARPRSGDPRVIQDRSLDLKSHPVNKLIGSIGKVVEFALNAPDRLIHNFRASKSLDRRFVCSP